MRRRLRVDKVLLVAAFMMLLIAAAIVAPRLVKLGVKPETSELPVIQQPIDAEPEEIKAIVDEEIPIEGGQLAVYIPTNSPSLNPLLVETREMREVLSLVYEELIAYDTSLRLTPSLAESWEAVDGDGLTWKISLRKGAYWHGTDDAVTAADVVYTIGLLKSTEYADSPYAYHMKSIAGYEAADNSTVLITASSPGASVLQALTFPVVSAKYFNAGQRPVGTGPYRLIYGDRRYGLQMEANDRWWKQPPYIKSVIVRCAQDNDTALGSIELRQLNYVPSTSLSSTSYRELGATGMLELMGQQCETLIINHMSKKLQNVLVRKAIAYGIDRREIISRAYLNHAVASDVPVPPDSWLYDSASKVYDYNTEKAKECLAEAGWKDYDADGIVDRSDGSTIESLRLTLLVNNTPSNQLRKDAAQLIASQLKEIGIEVEITDKTWTGEDDSYLTALKSGAFDIAMVGFNMDQSYDLTPYIGTNGSNNYGKYSDASVDALLTEMLAASNDKDIKDSAIKIQKTFVEKLPFLPLYFRTSFVLYSESLRGIKSVRDTDVFNGVEKWFFNAEGRETYSGQSLGELSDWASFDGDSGQHNQKDDVSQQE